MSEFIEIHGGERLSGSVEVGGAKNAALPILIATLLTGEKCTIHNVPNLTDTNLVVHLLEHFGSHTIFHNNTVESQTERLVATDASYSLVKALRASFWVLAPLLARGRAARVALPGGDLIGARPVDIHLEGFAKMGADISIKHGVVYATAVNGLKPVIFDLRFPSVGATHQLLMAASLTPGTTVLRGCAKEPEVVALAALLNAMGAEIHGAGSSTIEIKGEEQLGGAEIRLIGDRIEAGTYLLAGAITGGQVQVTGIDPMFFGDFLKLLSNTGLNISCTDNSITVKRDGAIKPIRAVTGPFPEFATDLQPMLMAYLTLCEGSSSIEETVYEGRFGHVSELCRMGASIRIEDRIVSIDGVPQLTGAPVEALDIRAGAALAIAALAADGISKIHEPHHIRRGYENFEKKLASLGARISNKVSDPEDFMFTGC